MKTFIGILLFGLLAFVGCSGSNDGTSTTVGQATLVAPWAIIETSTPTYKWTPVSKATKYRLLVQDVNQASSTHDAHETYIIDERYTAEESGCASEDEGLCMVTPDIEVFEKNTWKVQACANEKCGVWSEPMNYDFSAMNAPRFTDHGDGTVTDNRTRLMWSKNANPNETRMDWEEAKDYCDAYWTTGHSDWRLPSLNELTSLTDDTQYDPPLPPGNPFINVIYDDEAYWTATPIQYVYVPSAYIVGMSRGIPGYDDVIDSNYVWPVRAGN